MKWLKRLFNAKIEYKICPRLYKLEKGDYIINFPYNDPEEIKKIIDIWNECYKGEAKVIFIGGECNIKRLK